MLVLTRRLDQSIMIGDPFSTDSVEVTVVEVRGDQVRIGIKAPQSVTVHRKEVYLQIQEENRQAAQSGHPSAVSRTLDEIQRKQNA